MFDIAFKNLSARKLRTALSVVAIIGAVALIVILNTFVDAGKNVFEKSTDPLKGKIAIVEHGEGNISFATYIVGTDSEIALETWDKIYNDISIKTQIERYEMAYTEIIETEPMGWGQWYIIGITTYSSNPSYFFGDEFEIKTGSLDDGALLGSGTAEHFGIDERHIGRPKNITTRTGDTYTLQIGGMLSPAREALNIDFAVVTTLDDAQRLFAKPDRVGYILITPKGSDKELASEIESKEWRVDALTSEDFKTVTDEAIASMSTFMNSISTVSLFIAILMIMTVFFMAVRERTKEIATLRACGAKRSWVLSLVITESVIISFLGGILGVLISYFIVWFWFGIFVVFSTALIGFILGVMVGPLSSIIPAIRASRMEPVRGFAYE